MMVLALALTLAATGPAVAESDNVKCTNTASATATGYNAGASATAANFQSSHQQASNTNIQAGNVAGGGYNVAGPYSTQVNGNAIQFSYQSNYQSSNQDQCET